jgi:hypothetical protein
MLRSSGRARLVGLTLVLVLVGAGVAYSAASPSAKLAKQDRVYGGGQFGPGCFTPTICFVAARNISIDAHSQGDGSEPVGNSTYGAPNSTFEQTRTVTCLRVEGSRAVVGGIIESGSGAGDWYAQYFVDRGGPSAGPGSRDLASPSFEDVASAAGWPAGFPYTCPSPTTGFPGGEPVYLELDEGDIVVQDAPQN